MTNKIKNSCGGFLWNLSKTTLSQVFLLEFCEIFQKRYSFLNNREKYLLSFVLLLNSSIVVWNFIKESVYLYPFRRLPVARRTFILATSLILSWRRSLSYRYQSNDLQRKSMNWFLYDKDIRHERTKEDKGWGGCSLKIGDENMRWLLLQYSKSVDYSENVFLPTDHLICAIMLCK